MSMDYKELKSAIYKSAKRVGKRGVKFEIDLETLNSQIKKMDMYALPIGSESYRICEKDIPIFAEYYRANKMMWLSGDRYMTTLAFVDLTKVDDQFYALLEELETSKEEDPDVDHVAAYAQIIGKYHCYFALIVGYENNSPGSYGKISYFIACRANKVIILDPEYVYHSKPSRGPDGSGEKPYVPDKDDKKRPDGKSDVTPDPKDEDDEEEIDD